MKHTIIITALALSACSQAEPIQTAKGQIIMEPELIKPAFVPAVYTDRCEDPLVDCEDGKPAGKPKDKSSKTVDTSKPRDPGTGTKPEEPTEETGCTDCADVSADWRNATRETRRVEKEAREARRGENRAKAKERGFEGSGFSNPERGTREWCPPEDSHGFGGLM